MKLTLPQQDVYYEQLLYPDAPIYNIGAKTIIHGTISYELLNKAYIALINQHDAYRSYIVASEDMVTMQTHEYYDGALKYIDMSLSDEAEKQANDYIQEQFSQPFAIHKDKQLHRFALIKVHDTFHYLFSVYHHLITDGWAISLMYQRLINNYNELLQDGKISSQYPYSYSDFEVDDSNYAKSEAYEKDLLYWKERFRELPNPLFEKKSNKAIPESKRKSIIIKRSVYNQLEQIGRDAGCSLFHVIVGMLFLYFGKKHQNKDFAIGLPVLNRGKAAFKKTVGLFMGIVPLRIKLKEDDNFNALIKTIKNQLRLDYRHQRFPLGKLIKELGLFQEKERIFNITLSYEKQDYTDNLLNTVTKPIPLPHHSELVALAVFVREFEKSEDVTLDFDYNFNYFNESEINAVTTHFQQLIKEIITTSDKPVFEYNYITAEEKETLLHTFNATQYNYPTQETLIDLINSQAQLNPDKVVLEDESTKYTYAQLEALSNGIADYIGTYLPNNENAPIAVFMDRSADLVVVLLGILKSGRAYIPLDPSFPSERLDYIVQHSGVQQIIGDEVLKNKAPGNASYISAEVLLVREANEHVAINKSHSEQTAYIIYTSGSTGLPKGVAISHQALLNFLISMQHTPGIRSSDTFFSVTTPSFDISILEFFAPLIAGARLYMADKILLSDPLAIVEKIHTVNPSIIQTTPSFYQMLYNANWKGSCTMKILCGGDLLSESLAEKLLKTNAELWNMYGPTETTIWSSCKKIQQATEAANIGKPIHNTQMYILDNNQQLLPVGCIGTIYISGDGLAQGYYKNETLTNERFISNPFLPNQKMYNTGDLGKWNENGEIEFLGRNDYQVKVRGYRIELGEIETKLHQLETVKAAVVVAQKQTNQEAILIAYVIPKKNIDDTSILIKALRKQLPDYMVPYTIVTLESFPLTPNKKIDRKALSARDIHIDKQLARPPKTVLEKQVLEFFKNTLKTTETFSTEDNFFSLGGHSLNAVKLINRIDEHYDCRLTLKDVFENPTVQQLASFIEKQQAQQPIEIVKVAEQELYDITPSQYHMWMASQNVEKSIAYNMTGGYMIHGELDKALLDTAIIELVKKYEVLRTGFVAEHGVVKQKITSANEINMAVKEFFIEDGNVSDTFETFANTPFDLEEGCLCRLALVYQHGDPYSLLFKTHHIVMDGWSLELLIQELLRNYNARRNGKQLQEESLPFQFKDYANWYAKQLEKEKDTNTVFWKNYLQGYTWKATVPKDAENIRNRHTGSTIDTVFLSIDMTTVNRFLKQHHISLHTLLAATFNFTLHKTYGHDDICIGTVNTGRTPAAVEKQLGMFVKTLPLRTQLAPEEKISELIQDAHQNILNINIHEDIPASVLNTLQLDALLVLQNTPVYDQIKINEETTLQHYPMKVAYSRLPLLITISIEGNYLKVNADYNTINYDAVTIELLLMTYEKTLEAVIDHPDRTLHQIDIDSDIEKSDTLSIDFNF